MKRELSNKIIFNDFVNKTILNEAEQEILLRYIKNESIVQISEAMAQSTSSISRTIAQIKEKYCDYKKLEVSKLLILKW